jgi:voltage-gated potassium channel Kch
VPSLNVVERRMNRFLRNPASVRGALSVIVLATALVVVGAGILMRLIDHEEYGSIWVGMWWAVQTVTTVGYGDVTPKDPNGRIVATFVMFEGIAFLAIITAAITSTFVERAGRRRQREEEAEQQLIDARFDELDRRLERIEQTLSRALPK